MKYAFLIFFLLVVVSLQSQIKGNLKSQAGQKIELIGYDNYKLEVLGVTTLDSLGNFTLIYPNTYKRMAFLKAEDKSSLAFILTEKEIKINGNHLNEKENLRFTNSDENIAFTQYFEDYQRRQKTIIAWYYLKNQYKNDMFFSNQKNVLKNIDKELNRIYLDDKNYLDNLSKEKYVSWFLPLKKMVSKMQIILKYNRQEIPELINSFRKIDFNNPKFKTSGLLQDLINGHYVFIENSGMKKESLYREMNESSDYLLDNLKENEKLLNETSEYLFDLLEQRNLHKASEYLAVQLLNLNSCNLSDKLIDKLELYRKLKPGKIAPEVLFSDNTKLSDIKLIKLLVFGASWCSKCKEDIIKLSNNYDAWKEKGVEVVYISIDTNKTDFENTYKNVPWKTDCQFKAWDTKAVKEYHVFATPTYFLLDKDLKIILRPNSVEQTNSWINSNIHPN
tara:strand:+ start:12043 stop:13386 length:1344 start_codon:yes stop_codon:yes gene_type:complete